MHFSSDSRTRRNNIIRLYIGTRAAAAEKRYLFEATISQSREKFPLISSSVGCRVQNGYLRLFIEFRRRKIMQY